MKRVQCRWLWAVVMVVAMGLPSLAMAEDECTSDADCGEGFTCEAHQEPCPATPCEPGGDCSSDCEPTTVQECVPEPPPSCDTAADCATDLVCVTVTYETCSGGDSVVACAPDTDCDAGSAPDVSCTSETEGYCVPPYLAPCQTNSDCGAGFTCEQSEICECSGGGSTGSGGSIGTDGSRDSVDAGSYDENCNCEPAGEGRCQLEEVACTSDSDCAGDLICDEIPDAAAGEAAVCRSTADGGTYCESVDAGSSGSSEKYCQPEDIERWIGVGGAVRGDSEYSSGGSGSDEERDYVSSQVDRGNSASSSGGGSSSESAGCSSTGTSGQGGSLAAVLFFLIGLVGIRRRG